MLDVKARGETEKDNAETQLLEGAGAKGRAAFAGERIGSGGAPQETTLPSRLPIRSGQVGASGVNEGRGESASISSCIPDGRRRGCGRSCARTERGARHGRGSALALRSGSV
jgi:hypothetical protein